MSHRRTLFRFRLAGALAGATLFSAGVFAQTPNGFFWSTNQTPGLAVTLQPGELVGHEQVIREFIRSGTSEFMFVVPEGLGSKTPSAGMIVLTSCDMRYYVSIRIAGPSPTNSGLKEALRERIASQYPHLSGLDAFTTTVADQEGTGFQLRQALPGVGGRLIRIIWVPFEAGVLEFALNADNNSASAGKGALDNILLTFRSNERGKLEIVKRSDKT